MKQALTLWVQVDGISRPINLAFPNLKQGVKAGTALLIRRPEVARVELRGKRDVLWATERADWEGWL